MKSGESWVPSWSTGAPAAISACAISTWPLWDAQNNGVDPSHKRTASGAAPASSSAFTAAGCFCSTAL